MRRALRAVLTSLVVSAAFALPAAAAGTKSTPAASTPAASTSAAPSLPPAGATTPFAPGVPQSGAVTPTSTSPATVVTPSQNTSTNGSSGLSGTGIVLVVVGALALLVGISFFIWYDARRRAPVKAAARGGHGGLDDVERRSKPGSKRQQKPRKLSPAERRRRKRGRAR